MTADHLARTTPSRVFGLVGGGSLLAATVGAGLALTAAPAGASTFTVSNLNDNGLGSLRQAIIDANNSPTDDVIEFAPGLNGTISLTTGMMTISDELSLVGPGSASVTIDAGGASQIFYIYDQYHVGALDVTISGLTLTGGYVSGWGGGAIASWSADTTLRDLTITNSTALGSTPQSGRGGAVFAGFSASGQARDARLTIEDCHFSGNYAQRNGGAVAFYLGGGLDISDSVIDGNTAGIGGGGIYEDQSNSTTTISGTRISGNSAPDGSAIRVQRQTITGVDLIDRISVVGNTATGQAGSAISLDHNVGSTHISSSTISGNTGGGVGGMDATAVRIMHSTVAGNTGIGVRSFNRGINIDESILADNATDLDTSADVNWSLVETGGTNIVAGANNIVGVDPALQSLLQYSSTAWVRPFTNSSAAFNAGDPAFSAPPSTDQTGRARVAFGRIDIGAFELQAEEPTTTTTAGGQVTPAFTG